MLKNFKANFFYVYKIQVAIFPSFVYLCSRKFSQKFSERNASLAQLVEQLTRNEQVVGSSPMGGSTKKHGFRTRTFFG